MLTELKVSQFAIIDSIHIHFNQGLNILSGETGAGKSILIKSLALLMGATSSSQDIRSNEKRASIEGVFKLNGRKDILKKLDEMGLDSEDDRLIVHRLLQKNGKSKVYLNGHICGVGDLRKIIFPLVSPGHPVPPLIELTGQHENKDLLSPRYQMDTLDQFCEHFDLRQQVADSFDSVNKKNRQIEELKKLYQQREQQMDFLDFQIKEIESMDLQEDEDRILSEKIKNLKNKEQWQFWIQQSSDYLNNSETSILSQLNKILTQAPEHSSVNSIKEQITQGFTQLEDVAFQLEQLAGQEPEGEESLDNLEKRLSRLRKIQKKSGSEIPGILKHLEQMKKEYDNLNHLSENLTSLEQDCQKEKQNLLKLCEKLRNQRKSGAGKLAREVNRELKDLNMKEVEFFITILPQTEISSTGQDRVVFQIQSGKKDHIRDMAQVASGGELSRILLSLKQVAGSGQYPRTFLFDEVDSGVSGPTAEKVGVKLKKIARHQQVICVTHLPQVARFGDHHFFIEKKIRGDRVQMSVGLLDQKQRIREIARLISGEKQTRTSLAHARELLGQSPC